MVLLNMILPTIYDSNEPEHFWFIVIGTIIIETLVIKLMLKYSWKKSFSALFIGNIISTLAGIFIMLFSTTFLSSLANKSDWNDIFIIISLVLTFILMFAGSVFLEIVTIKLIFNDTVKKLFIPLLIGNILTYLSIFLLMVANGN